MDEALAAKKIQTRWRGVITRHHVIEMMFDDSSDGDEQQYLDDEDPANEHEHRLCFLKSVSLLDNLSDAELSQLAEVMAHEIYEDDEAIVEQGDEVRQGAASR